MDITGYIGKKVDIYYEDGKIFSGYLSEYLFPEDTEDEEESLVVMPIDREVMLDLPLRGIKKIGLIPNIRH